MGLTTIGFPGTVGRRDRRTQRTIDRGLRRTLAIFVALMLIGTPGRTTRPEIHGGRQLQARTGLVLRVERTIAASRERVFRAWLDPDAVRTWFVYNARVDWTDPPLIEATPGGRLSWSVVGASPTALFRFTGRYREITAPERLAFTWDWDQLPIEGIDGPGHTVVSVTFVQSGADTRILLTQTGLPSEDAREAHRTGWNRCLDGLASFLTGPAQAIGQPLGSYIRVNAPIFALEHVRIVDGTGAQPRTEQTIVVEQGAIATITDAGSARIPANALRLDYSGYTAIPGLVGMHDHLFYSSDYFTAGGDKLAHDMPFSYPRLYLAAGVTTLRTTGSFEPYTDLEIKKAIESGKMLGPAMNVTGPYLEGAPFPLIQIHKLTSPEDARRTVDYWASEGAGSFKVYTDISRAELAAAIEAAHRHGLTITGHLCSVGFREAAELGIDGVEHGLWTDTEFVIGKQPDLCPSPHSATAVDMQVNGEAIRATIKSLVDRHVAVTSTLPAWEEFFPTRPEAAQRVLEALSTDARAAYLEHRRAQRAAMADKVLTPEGESLGRYQRMFPKEMEFERAFVRAGGLLLAGCDCVLGGDIAGYGDQREVELLVEAGFAPVEAVKIATLNGARFLGMADRIGSLEAGKRADIVLVKGDPAANISDIENVEVVFKQGVGYDSRRLVESVRGQVGIR